MTSYLVAFALALAIAALLTPLVRNLSLRLKIYDVPDGRKVHSRAIPRTGGIAIVVAFLAPVIGIAATQARVGQIVYENSVEIEQSNARIEFFVYLEWSESFRSDNKLADWNRMDCK